MTDIQKDGHFGKMKIKGLCYEDIVNILISNGYYVFVETDPLSKGDTISDSQHTIFFGSEEYKSSFFPKGEY